MDVLDVMTDTCHPNMSLSLVWGSLAGQLPRRADANLDGLNQSFPPKLPTTKSPTRAQP